MQTKKDSSLINYKQISLRPLATKLRTEAKNLIASLSRRLLWSLPKNKSIVILDETGSENLIPSLVGMDYFILRKRTTIYIKYLLAAIFIDMKINIHELRYYYNARMLDRLDPILVITNIDNCPLYMRLDKERKKGKFLTVQNGNHWVNRPPELPERYHNLFLEGTPYYSHLAGISAYDIDYYSKNGVTIQSYYPIGSIHTSKYITGFSKKPKKFDLCVVTNSNNARPENIKLWEYIIKYIESHDVSACLTLKWVKGNSRDEDFKKHIKGLDKFFSCSKVEIIERNKDSTQNASDISEVTIGAFSTVLRQTFARGNKIYPINFADSSISPPYDLLGYPLDPTYKEFNSHLDYLLSVDQQTYSERYKELMAYLDVFSPKNPPMKKLENIIKELVLSPPTISKNR